MSPRHSKDYWDGEPVKTLYVVTHPEAEHHVEGRVGGWFDSELTPLGLRHAQAIASRLRETIPFESAVEVYSSDLRRTTQTAEAIATTLGVTHVAVSDLREKSYGEAEGGPQRWLDERFIPPPAVGERMDHDEGIDGAETKKELAVRVYRAVESITRRPCPEQVIVTHGMALNFVITAWMRLPVEVVGYVAFKSTSGGVTRLVEDDYFQNRALVSLNDTTHF